MDRWSACICSEFDCPLRSATPNKSEPAEDLSSEQHRDADELAAQAFALANPASEVLEDAPGAAPTAGEPGSERWGDIDNELDMALGTGEAAEDPHPRKVIDGPGYVEFYFSDVLGRSKVPHWAALGAFHDAAQSIDEIPLLPTDGSDTNPSRTMFQFYMDYPFCKTFATATPEITVQNDDGEQVTMQVRARACMPGKPSKYSLEAPTSFLETEAVYMDIQLDKGYTFNAITKDMVISEVRKWGLTVYRGARCQVKIPKDPSNPESEKISIGASGRTGKINILVMPVEGDADNFEWWRHPTINIRDKEGHWHHLRYRVGGPKAKALCADWSGCKRKSKDCTSKCVELATARKLEGQSLSAGTSFTRRPTGADRKRARDEQADAGAALLSRHSQRAKLAADPSAVPKHQQPCPHFAAGRCRSGRSCGFKHEGARSDWGKIPCNLPKRGNGFCIGGFFCAYKHEG